MQISSRTPEGYPNQCPFCNVRVRLEPSTPIGDAPCPVCGNLLWFVKTRTEQWVFSHSSLPTAVKEFIEARIGGGGLDSLELIELVMEFEDRFGLSIRDEDVT